MNLNQHRNFLLLLTSAIFVAALIFIIKIKEKDESGLLSFGENTKEVHHRSPNVRTISENRMSLTIDEALSESGKMKFFEFVRSDSSGALELLEELRESVSISEYNLFSVIYAQALAVSAGAPEAIEWAKNLDAPAAKVQSLGAIFGMVSQNQEIGGIEALGLIKDFKKEGWARGYIHGFLQNIDSKDWESSISWISKELSEEPDLYYTSITNVLAKVGLEDDADFMSAIAKLDDNEGMLSAVTSSLGLISMQDPSIALRLAEQVPLHDSDVAMLKQVAVGNLIMLRGPDEALKYLEDLNGDTAMESLTSSSQEWLNTDPRGALQWIQKLDLKTQEEFLKDPLAAETLGRTFPYEILEGMNASKRQSETARVILEDWSNSSPEKAGRWISNSAESLQEIYIKDFVRGLSQENLDVVSDYVEALKVSERIKVIAREEMAKNPRS